MLTILFILVISNPQKQSCLPCKYCWCSFYVETSCRVLKNYSSIQQFTRVCFRSSWGKCVERTDSSVVDWKYLCTS